jgi:hypothetical protein
MCSYKPRIRRRRRRGRRRERKKVGKLGQWWELELSFEPPRYGHK